MPSTETCDPRQRSIGSAGPARALRAQTEISSYPAPGLGNDLRIRCSSVVGAALEVDNSVIHLCAFRLAVQSEAERHDGNHRSHMAGTEMRRRYIESEGLAMTEKPYDLSPSLWQGECEMPWEWRHRR